MKTPPTPSAPASAGGLSSIALVLLTLLRLKRAQTSSRIFAPPCAAEIEGDCVTTHPGLIGNQPPVADIYAALEEKDGSAIVIGTGDAIRLMLRELNKLTAFVYLRLHSDKQFTAVMLFGIEPY